MPLNAHEVRFYPQKPNAKLVAMGKTRRADCSDVEEVRLSEDIMTETGQEFQPKAIEIR